MNKLQWYKNLYWAIENISNLEQQKQAWFGKSESVVSSFSEDITFLYDDFNFELFLEKEQHNISKELLSKLKIFNSALNKFIEENLETDDDAQIIQNEAWIQITKLAKECLI